MSEPVPLQRPSTFLLYELASMVVNREDSFIGLHTRLSPFNRIWPMGISWSTYMAKATMLGACLKAGLKKEHLLCLEEPPPDYVSEVAIVAMDNIMMIPTSPNVDSQAMARAGQKSPARVVTSIREQAVEKYTALTRHKRELVRKNQKIQTKIAQHLRKNKIELTSNTTLVFSAFF